MKGLVWRTLLEQRSADTSKQLTSPVSNCGVGITASGESVYIGGEVFAIAVKWRSVSVLVGREIEGGVDSVLS